MADIKNTFSKGLTVLNVKTSTFLESNKIKTYITTLSNEAEALKKEIGDRIYEEWASTGSISLDSVLGELREVEHKLQMIQEQEAEAARLSEKEKQILGAQQDKKGEPSSQSPAKAVLTCPNCSQSYDQPSRFCRKCGARMN